jgi:hypothetical protein
LDPERRDMPEASPPVVTAPPPTRPKLKSSATAFIHLTAKPMQGRHGVLRDGYLFKLPSSGKGGAWQRRYLCVSTDAIRWYPDEAAAIDGKPKGAMPFSAQTTVALEGEGEEDEVLVVAEGRRKLTLRAGRNEDLGEWQEEIAAILEPLRQSGGGAGGGGDGQHGSGGGGASPGSSSSSSPRFWPGKLISGRL